MYYFVLKENLEAPYRWQSFYDESWYIKREKEDEVRFWTVYKKNVINSRYSLVSVNMDAYGYFVVVLKKIGSLHFLKLTEEIFYSCNNISRWFETRDLDGFWILRKQGNN